MELMHECSPKNSKNEITKEAEEEIKKRGVSMERSKVGTKKDISTALSKIQ